MAQYDCTPSNGLTFVDISFEMDVPQLKVANPEQGLAKIASQLTGQMAQVDRAICLTPVPSPTALHAGLTMTQCGIRWRDMSDPQPHTYGVATMVLGRGSSFIRFTRRCVDAQCEASLVPFATFFDSFDAHGFGEKPAR